MTTKNHTDVTLGAPGNSAVVNAPLGQLDNALADLETQFGDYIALGGLPNTSASLTIAQPLTRGFVINSWVNVAAQNLVMTASSDNYVDLDSSGVYHITAVAVAAAAPAVFANSLRLYRATTSGTAVTKILDLRVTQPLNFRGAFDPLKYGAGGGDALQDTTAINAAIQAAFNAGGGEVFCRPIAIGYFLKRFLSGTYAQKGGGILLLPGVSLKGFNTKLTLQDNCAFITNKGPHNYLPTIATIQANIVIGDTNHQVDSSAGFVVGDTVYVSPTQNQYDLTSAGPGYFCEVTAIPDGTHITVSKPAPIPMWITAPAAPTLSDGGAGVLPAGTYTIGFTYVYGNGAAPNCETQLSPTSAQVIAASHQVGFASVALPPGVFAIRWYIVSNTAGATNGFVLQQTVAAAGNINVQGNGVAAPDKGLAMSTPVDGGFPANGGNYWRRIIRLDSLYENLPISGFNMVNDIPNGGNAEFGVDMRFARNIAVTNATGADLGAGNQATFCEGVTFKNYDVRQVLAQGGANYKGRGCGDYNNVRTTWEDIRIQKFDGNAIFVESYTKQVQYKKLHLVVNTPNARVAAALIYTGQETEVDINGLLVEGFGGTYQGQPVDLTDTGANPSFLTMKDLEVRTAQDIRTIRLDILSGKLILGPASPVSGYYLEAKRWSKRFALTPSMAAVDIGLPLGLIKRMKVYVSTLTGLTNFQIGSVDRTGATQWSVSLLTGNLPSQPALAAGKVIDFTEYFGRIGTNYPHNNAGVQKKSSITSGASVPANAYGVIEMEFFEQIQMWPSAQETALAIDDGTQAQVDDGKTISPGATILGTFASYNSIALAGLGLPAIYKAPATLTGQTAAVASATTITSPNDGNKHLYRVGGVVNITVHGTESINLQCTYTDDGGTARTMTLTLKPIGGVDAVAANAAGPWVADELINVNPNTAITILTAGTFTGATYNLTPVIEQLS